MLQIFIYLLLHIPFAQCSSKVFIERTQGNLMIYITSGPNHWNLREAARLTWLKPCVESAKCGYKFFVDSEPVPALSDEEAQYSDMFFRTECRLMDRHPKSINYGTAYGYNISYAYISDYKIDWKVCFLQWSMTLTRKIDYHAFVEDDSFTCTKNLLHQIDLLTKYGTRHHITPFIMGTPNYHGFDDSALLFTHEVAKAFTTYYPDAGLNCTTNDLPVRPSFGNSWEHCGWKSKIEALIGKVINHPYPQCSSSPLISNSTIDTALKTLNHNPCISQWGIFHHSHDASQLLHKPSPRYDHHKLCENMIFMDKLKSPYDIYNLSALATSHRYYDFSSVFLNHGPTGWEKVITEALAHNKTKRNH
jgi:hypothetical protein